MPKFNSLARSPATNELVLMDMFWGDRYGKPRDPFGHEWDIATHEVDMTIEEMRIASAEAMKECM